MKYGRFKYKGRITPLPIPPATVVVGSRKRRGEKGPGHRLSASEVAWIEQHNDAQAVRNILGKSRGWVNAVGISELVGFGGNIFGIREVIGDFGVLQALKPGDPMPDFDNHLLVHMLTATTFLGQPRLFADGIRAFHPFIIEADPCYVWLGDIDVFSAMPSPLWPGEAPSDLAGYPAKVLKDTWARQTPDGSKTFLVREGQVVNVSSELRGWAKIGDRRWLPLDSIQALA